MFSLDYFFKLKVVNNINYMVELMGINQNFDSTKTKNKKLYFFLLFHLIISISDIFLKAK